MNERRRSGGRAGRRAARVAQAAEQVPFLTRHLTPFEVMSEEGLETIEHNAETVLEQVGVEIHDLPEALHIFADAGADVDGTRVRFPRGLARQLVTDTAPAVFTQAARNPERSVQIGDPHTVFAPGYGSPFVTDLDRGRRYATLEDFQNLAKLTYLSPGLHHAGGTLCEPVDLPVTTRHLDMLYTHIRYSDKPFMGSVTSPERAADTIEMARILFGKDTVDSSCVVVGLCNANSPLSWDRAMLGSAKVYAEAGQAPIITPFILSGAMSPVTVAGTATLTLAEALVGMAFTQLVRPGAPVIFGSFASSMSMQTGAPTFGTPEPAMVLFTMAKLARRLGVPFRSGGSLSASKTPDYQAAYESAMTFLPTVLAGVNFVLHSAGWLEGGLTMSYEKFMLDADQVSMAQRLTEGPDLSANGYALDTIVETGPGSHFLGSAHTLEHYETAFWRSELADNSSFEEWESKGSPDAATRANQAWKQKLASYEPPPLDEAVDEALREFIERRKAELPDTETP